MDNRAYFYALKSEARRRTAQAINKRVKPQHGLQFRRLTLCSILGREVGDAIEFEQERWKAKNSERLGRTWQNLAISFSNAPDHFDLAIWQEVEGEQVLVAMALGNPSNARSHLTLKWVERYFGDNHLAGRALEVVLTCAEEYAKLLGSQRVLIKDPVDAVKYERYGYRPFTHPSVPHGGSYLSKELSDE